MPTVEAVDSNQSLDPGPYLAELGKGILLTGAKLKLLDDHLTSEARSLREQVSRECETLSSGREQDVKTLQTATTREASNLKKQMAEIRREIDEALKRTETQTVQRIAQAHSQTDERVRASEQTVRGCIDSACQTILSQQETRRRDLVAQISGFREGAYTRLDNALSADLGLQQLVSIWFKRLAYWLVALTVLTGGLVGLLVTLAIKILQKGGS
jgi:hypothetical protein